MLEAILVMTLVSACMYMPMRNKTFEQLTPAQQLRVQKAHAGFMRTKKGRETPELSAVDYLPVLQKQGVRSLIVFFIALPIYVAAIIYLYPTLFAS